MNTHSQNANEAADTHPGRPDLQHDHTALLDLMAARADGLGAGVTSVATAVRSGDWNDPRTWGLTAFEQDTTYVIPEGISVIVDGSPAVKAMSVVVHGELSFATDAQTKMFVDEILTAPGSVLKIGSSGDPVTGNIDIIIREDTPAVTDHGRVAIDPDQLGKGIVTHGAVEIEGAHKTSHLKVSDDPMAGDTTLIFDELPAGWQPGDKIVIAATHISDEPQSKAAIETPMKIGVLRAFDNNPNNGPYKDIGKYTGSKQKAAYDKWMEEFQRDDPDFDPSKFDVSDPSTHPSGPGAWRFEVDAWDTQDEMRIVTGVTENDDGTWTVHLSEALDYNHDAPKNVGAAAGRIPEDFYTSVGNYSRNVTISSEVAHSDHPYGSDAPWVGDGDGLNSGNIHDRGHVMFMHNPDIEVRNVEFAGLGRTDKLQMLDDKNWKWGLAASDSEKDLKFGRWKMFPLDEDGNRVGARDEAFADRDPFDVHNAAGRYSLHVHQTGVDTSIDPAVLQGNAVWGSPGWGIVHHDSHLNILDNSVFGVNGGGIVSETGNETGAWENNLVIKTTGSGGGLFDSGGNEGREFVNNDGFHQGVAFGFESRFITSEGNIAASTKFGYMFVSPINHNQPESGDNFLHEQGYDPFFGDQDISMRQSPTREFIDNEVFASQTGFGSTLNKAFPNTTVVSTIDGFDSWHNDKGVTLSYVRGYNFNDNIYVGDTEREFEKGLGPRGWDPSTDTDMNRLTNNHFENLGYATGHPEADVMVNNTYTNVKSVWQRDSAIADTLAKAGGGFAHHHRDNGFDEGTVIAENFEDTPRDINHMRLVILESSELKIDNPGDGIYWHGYTEDAVIDASNLVGGGTTFFDFTIAVNMSYKVGSGLGLRHTTNWNDLIKRDGFYSDDDGNLFVLADLVFGSRVTASVAVHKVAIALGDTYPLPPQAMHMGKLPHGMSKENPYSDAIIVDLRIPGTSGNQLTDAEMQAVREYLRPDADTDAGEYAWQVEDYYRSVEDGGFDRSRYDQNASELKVLDTDAYKKTFDVGHSDKIDLFGDGSTSWRDAFSSKFQPWHVDDVIEYALAHSGEGDVAIVGGGARGNDHITLAINTGEVDFLRIEGTNVKQIIDDWYAENPNADNPTYDDPFNPESNKPGNGGGAGSGHTNAAPIATDDHGFSAEQGQPLYISVDEILFNDHDADGDPLAIARLTGASLSADKSMVMVDTSQVGPGTFSYQITDGQKTSQSATVYFEISEPTPPIEAPTGSVLSLTAPDPQRIGNSTALNTGASYDAKVHAVQFTTGDDVETRQMLYEQGGAWRGLSLFIEDGQLHMASWQLRGGDEWGYKVIHADIAADTEYSAALVLEGRADKTGSLTGYLDGSEVGSVEGVGYLKAHKNAIGLGQVAAQTVIDGVTVNKSSPFEGEIGAVLQYNRVLDANELAQLDTYLRGFAAFGGTASEDENSANATETGLPRSILWAEDFQDAAEGARAETGKTAWSATVSAAATQEKHGVSNGRYEFSETTNTANQNGAVTVWRSGDIDVSDATNFNLAFEVRASGGMEMKGDYFDFINVYAVIDGVRDTLYTQKGDGGSPGEALELDFDIGRPGQNLAIEIEAKTTSDKETYSIDDIVLSGTMVSIDELLG